MQYFYTCKISCIYTIKCAFYEIIFRFTRHFENNVYQVGKYLARNLMANFFFIIHFFIGVLDYLIVGTCDLHLI